MLNSVKTNILYDTKEATGHESVRSSMKVDFQ